MRRAAVKLTRGDGVRSLPSMLGVVALLLLIAVPEERGAEQERVLFPAAQAQGAGLASGCARFGVAGCAAGRAGGG